MWKRRLGWLVLSAAALFTYLFENNAGTRALLAALLLTPPLAALLLRLLGQTALADWDVFGLFRRPRGEMITVRVRVPAPPAPPSEETPGEGTGYSLSRAGSDPSETFGIRDYIPGDPINQIHWKLTAKLDKPLIREYGFPLEDPPAYQEVPQQVELPPDPSPSPRSSLRRGVGSLCLYAALWGSICHMAALSTLGLLPLLAGGALTLIAALSPRGSRRREALLWGLLGAAALAGLLAVPLCLDGAKLLLDRLFMASEARQAYVYEKFTVFVTVDAVRLALLPLGLLTGLICGIAARARWDWLSALPALGLCGAVAYLGVSPHPAWLCLLAVALVLCLVREPGSPAATGGALTALAAVLALTLVLFPHEDPRLSAWSEGARDVLATQTVAYAGPLDPLPPSTPTPPPREDLLFYQPEDTPVDLGGDLFTWSRPVYALAVILLFALLLFIPALLSDRLKRRRARNRAPLSDPQPAAAIRASFLYALRWLMLGGLTAANLPFEAYAGEIGQRFSPSLQARFEQVLPLWREAAYSDHPMTPQQQALAGEFLDQAQAAAWAQMTKGQRLRAKYISAM